MKIINFLNLIRTKINSTSFLVAHYIFECGQAAILIARQIPSFYWPRIPFDQLTSFYISVHFTIDTKNVDTKRDFVRIQKYIYRHYLIQIKYNNKICLSKFIELERWTFMRIAHALFYNLTLAVNVLIIFSKIIIIIKHFRYGSRNNQINIGST